MITRPGCSASAIALRILATASGSGGTSVFTRMPRAAPIASAVRIVSVACCGPIETAMTSVALPASFNRSASSTAISSNGFIDILTLPSSTPEPSALTRIFTSLSTARLTGTRIFMACFGWLLLSSGAQLCSCCGAATYRRERLRSTDRTGEGKRAGKPAVDRKGLAVDVGRFVARQKQRHCGDFRGRAGALQRLELPDLAIGAALSRRLEQFARHSGFDQSGTDRIDAHAAAEKRIRRGLRETDHAGLAGAIGRTAGIGAQPGNRSGENNGPPTFSRHVRGGVFDREERSDQIDPQHLQPIFHRLLK